VQRFVEHRDHEGGIVVITAIGWGIYLSLIGLVIWPIKTIMEEMRQRSLDNDFEEFEDEFPFMWEEE
jgi:hypothetical protein